MLSTYIYPLKLKSLETHYTGSRWARIDDPTVLARRLRLLINVASIAFLVTGTFALALTTAVIIVSSVLSLGDTYFSGLGDLAVVVYLTVSGLISIYGYIELGDVLSAIESGRFDDVRGALLVWGLLGIFFGFVVPGVIIFLVLIRYYTTFIRVITAI